MKSAPDLSVILPVYNAELFLAGAIDSILYQDFRDFECIAIDDGSSDRSGAILDEYAASDARVRVVHQSNAGLVDTLNRGLALARAPLIARMDADDICLPGRFRAQVECFDRSEGLAVLGGHVVLIDGEGHPLRRIRYPPGGEALDTFIQAGSPLAHPAVMFRKDVVERAGGYRKALSHAEDYDLWLRIHDAGHEIRNLEIPLIEYRQHSAKVSVVHRRQQALATVVARLAHRARVAGMADPVEGLARIDETTLDLFDPSLKAGLEAEIFSIALGGVLYAGSEDVEQAFLAFSKLPIHLRHSDHAVDFLVRIVRHALAYGCYSIAFASIIRALAIAPLKTIGMMADKSLAALARSAHGRI